MPGIFYIAPRAQRQVLCLYCPIYAVYDHTHYWFSAYPLPNCLADFMCQVEDLMVAFGEFIQLGAISVQGPVRYRALVVI